ncbi:MAG: YjgN family protein [Pseudomonadota bacterium]
MNEHTPAAALQRFEFTGSGGEYFRIWIVNLVLSILTLGIYSAWAKVRTNRYFYGNTRLDGSGFEYHANPLAILKGRLIAVLLLLVYVFAGQMLPVAGIAFAVVLMLATPWIVWRSIQFNARMTGYRNVRFGFHGALGDAYRYLLLIPLLPLLASALVATALLLAGITLDAQTGIALIALAVLTTYLLFPYIQKSITAWYLNNTRYGQGRLQVQLSAGRYYLVYLCLLGWGLLITVVVGAIFGTATMFTGVQLAAAAKEAGGEIPNAAMLPLLVATLLLYAALLVIGVWAKAYVKVKIRNYVFGRIGLDDVLRLESDISTGRLFRFYLANILLLLCTLGLAYPWVKVRTARLLAASTRAHLSGSLDQYVSQQQSRQSAAGEEIGEAFDVDAGLDLAF